MSRARTILDRIVKRSDRALGPMTIKLCSSSQRMTKGEILRFCEEFEDIVKRDIVALRAEAGLPVAPEQRRG